ncbi:hypothetical protein ANAEL_00742 [Anaerolineales bacterium]|nr:hypothetical protein ANAEL_00742 [Anaerolineales bacterium]
MRKFRIQFIAILMFLVSCQPSFGNQVPTDTAQTSTGDASGVTTYSIPEWLHDPKTGVLMYTQWESKPKNLDGDSHGIAVLFNPLTGDRFSLTFEDGGLFQWIDNQTIGLSPLQSDSDCKSGMAYSYKIDLLTGNLAINDSTEQFCVLDILKWINVSTQDGSVEYFDGQNWVEFIPATPDIYNHHGAVSPDRTILAVTQSDLASGELNRIGIYDFATGKIKYIHYVQGLGPPFRFVGNNHKIAYFEENIPCLLNWDTLEKECGIPLGDEFQNAGLDYVDNDGTNIGLRYPGIRTTSDGGWVFCLRGIFSGQTSCPMNDLDIFKPYSFTVETYNGIETRIKANSVIGTLISPDEKFVYFTYGEYPPSMIQQAVVSMDGGSFFDLGLLDYEGFYSTSAGNGQWRPLP